MKLGVILGSTRKVRKGERVAKWLMSVLPNFKEFDTELLDLRDFPLPFFAEDASPDSLKSGYSTPVADSWAGKIDEMDAFIIITTEYNHGPAAVLKNALDYVYREWNKKPVAFVSYSVGSSGGMRAVEQLRQIVGELQMADMQAAVHIANILSAISEDGTLLHEQYAQRVKQMMEQLTWWAKALKSAREL